MPNNMSNNKLNTLYGISFNNNIKLGLKSNDFNIIEFIELENLKKKILELYILPFYNNDWNTIIQNLPFLDKIYELIEKQNNIYGNNSALFYKDTLKILEDYVGINYKFIKKCDKLCDNKNILKFDIKTNLIRIKPEYEIYNLIYGIPNININETYNIDIINEIIKLLDTDIYSFNLIKEKLLLKFK